MSKEVNPHQLRVYEEGTSPLTQTNISILSIAKTMTKITSPSPTMKRKFPDLPSSNALRGTQKKGRNASPKSSQRRRKKNWNVGI